MLEHQVIEDISRDDNFCLTHGYPTWPDPNGPDFTGSD